MSKNANVSDNHGIFVICGVDGTVSSIVASTGEWIGWFQSGEALIASHTAEDAAKEDLGEDLDDVMDVDVDGTATATTRKSFEHNYAAHEFLQSTYEGYDEEDTDVTATATVTNNENRNMRNELSEDYNPNAAGEDSDRSLLFKQIVPGLDGALYEIFEDRNSNSLDLHPLSMNVADVIDAPMRTCNESPNHLHSEFDDNYDYEEYSDNCGIVMGEKRTQIFALNPSTGSVSWMQRGKDHRKGFTTTAQSRWQKSANELLLQRENFYVRQINIETGVEQWNVTVGRFHALDFEHSNTANRSRTTSSQGSNVIKPMLSAPPTKRDNINENSRNDRSPPNMLPSLVFGEDGTTIIALDPVSNKVLWKRRTDTVIASVFGAVPVLDRDTRPPNSFTSYRDNFKWSEVRVLDMGDIANPLLSMEEYYLPVSSSKHSYLLDYNDNLNVMDASKALSLRYDDTLLYVNEFDRDKELQAPRLGIHHSTMFIAPHNKRKQQCFRNQLNDGIIYSSDETCLIDQNDSSSFHPIAITTNRPSLVESYSELPQSSYRTDTGLFLSWQVVAGFLGLVFFALIKTRSFYLKQKNKWEQELLNLERSNDKTNHMSKEGSENSSNMLHATSQHSKIPRKRSLRRVMSLPSIAGEYIRSSFSTPSSPNGRKRIVQSQSIGENAVDKGNETRSLNRTATSTTKSSNENGIQEASTLDGIPLVQYSRYSSEFDEICPIGEGGFGTVFRCKNKLDDREYATKKIKIESFVDSNGIPTKKFSKKLKRVLREVKALALLDHPNIVRYYTAWLELDRSEGSENISGSNSQSVSFQSTSFFQTTFTKHGDTTKVENSHIKSMLGSQNLFNNGGWTFGGRDLSTNFSCDERNENVCNSGSDIGFHWDRSDDDIHKTPQETCKSSEVFKSENAPSASLYSKPSFMNSLAGESSDDESSPSSGFFRSQDDDSFDSNISREIDCEKEPQHEQKKIAASEEKSSLLQKQRHMLYIQMQHCEHTLNEFLASPEKRRGPVGNGMTPKSDMSIDIPFALQIFSQIVKGVKYVHQKGLIHRDLKPSNCFLLDGQATIVKIGDFGLSRESVKGAIDSTKSTDSLGHLDHVLNKNNSKTIFGDFTNTAGVGTYLYASPEQISGRDYDASTDIFSLGVMLFELCYPMYTAMERAVTLRKVHDGIFPSAWHTSVAKSFPSLHPLLISMLSIVPSERPTANAIADDIEVILGGYTVFSLDRNSKMLDGSIYLRVEADEVEGILPRITQLIRNVSSSINIQQYSLKGQNGKAIMEFAISLPSSGDLTTVDILSDILKQLNDDSEIQIARRVTGGRSDSFETSEHKQ